MSNAIPTHHLPNIRHLEIHITYRCNLRCNHCSNLITQAPSNETMTIAKLQEMLDDSARLNWPWEWLVLHGGEPTMHPQFEDVCAALRTYKHQHNRDVSLFVCTNGHGDRVREQMRVAARYGVKPESSGKVADPNVSYHVPFSVAAIDTGEDYMLGCFQSSKCGISYTNQGYYECSPAASAFRVFGYEPMAKRLDDVTVDALKAGYALHCARCGYARVEDPGRMVTHKDVKGPQQAANVTRPMSETWKTATDAYKVNKPPVEPYVSSPPRADRIQQPPPKTPVNKLQGGRRIIEM